MLFDKQTNKYLAQKHEDFSLSELINSARISNQWEDGKYVVVPKHVETTWLHWPSMYCSDSMLLSPFKVFQPLDTIFTTSTTNST